MSTESTSKSIAVACSCCRATPGPKSSSTLRSSQRASDRRPSAVTSGPSEMAAAYRKFMGLLGAAIFSFHPLKGCVAMYGTFDLLKKGSETVIFFRGRPMTRVFFETSLSNITAVISLISWMVFFSTCSSHMSKAPSSGKWHPPAGAGTPPWQPWRTGPSP